MAVAHTTKLHQDQLLYPQHYTTWNLCCCQSAAAKKSPKERAPAGSSLYFQHANSMCSGNKNTAKKATDGASWGCSGDKSILAGTSYLVTHPHVPGQPSQGQPDTFHGSCASAQIYFFLNDPARLWNSRPAAHHCCGLHLIRPLCIICARPSEEFYELTFERVHPQQVTARRGALAAGPACALCQAASLSPAVGCGLCWVFGFYSKGLNRPRRGGKGDQTQGAAGPQRWGAATTWRRGQWGTRGTGPRCAATWRPPPRTAPTPDLFQKPPNFCLSKPRNFCISLPKKI